MRKKRMFSTFGKIILIASFVSLPLWAFHEARSQEKKGPIKIGINTELTGVMSESSTTVKMGYDLFLQEIGYKVAGREIKVIEYDNKTDVKLSMEVAQKLVEKDNVHLVGFGSNSAAAIAVRGYLEKVKVPMVVVANAGAERVTLPPNKYVFRLSYADGQGELPFGRYAHEKLGYKKMALMGPDYSGSTGKLWAFQQEFVKSGGEIVQTILWPLGEMDLGPYFAQLKPDVEAIFPFIPGGVACNRFLSQYWEMGLDKKGIKLATHWALVYPYQTLKSFGERMTGIISVGHYSHYYDTPENKRVTELYYNKYGKKIIMNDDVSVGYESMKFVWTALEAIRGNAEDTEAFLKAMHSTRIKGLCSSSISIDENGNVIRDWLIRQIQKRDGVVGSYVLHVIPQVKQPPEGYTLMPGKSN